MRSAILIIACSVFASSCLSPTNSDVEQPAVCEAPQSELEAARRAFFFAFPLYEMFRMRQRMLSAPGAEVNSLRHRTSLSRPQDRFITTPNNDTLYSAAWLDLSAGPVRFIIPEMGTRYHSAELMNAFSDASAMLRNDGAVSRIFLLAGPDWKGTVAADETFVRSPTRDAWLVIRTHVKGPADLEKAQRLQQAYKLEAVGSLPADHDFEERIPSQPGGGQFLDVVNAALARDSLPEVQSERLHCFSAAGIKTRISIEGAEMDDAVAQALDENIGLFYEETRQVFETVGTLRNGWRYPQSNIGEFGTDDLYRSAMALGGLTLCRSTRH